MDAMTFTPTKDPITNELLGALADAYNGLVRCEQEWVAEMAQHGPAIDVAAFQATLAAQTAPCHLAVRRFAAGDLPGVTQALNLKFAAFTPKPPAPKATKEAAAAEARRGWYDMSNMNP